MQGCVKLFAAALVFACTAGWASAAAPEGRALSIKVAGQLYGAICQNAFPNLEQALATAMANSFTQDTQTGLYEHPRLAIHFRINHERCNARFVALKGRDSLPGAEFAEWSASMISSSAQPGSPDIESSILDSRRFGVTVRRNK